MSTWKNNICSLLLLFILTNAGVSSAFFLSLLTPTDGKMILLGVFSWIQNDIAIVRIQLV
jgi:hypothetical protein